MSNSATTINFLLPMIVILFSVYFINNPFYVCMIFMALSYVLACCDVSWFRQPIDHFSTDKRSVTFLQRYLTHDYSCSSSITPLLFFCGNEGDVTAFGNFSGFLAELGAAWSAKVIYAEHRF